VLDGINDGAELCVSLGENLGTSLLGWHSSTKRHFLGTELGTSKSMLEAREILMVNCWELQKEYSKRASRDYSKDQWKAYYYLGTKLEQSMDERTGAGSNRRTGAWR
jgi:hypothetical protein